MTNSLLKDLFVLELSSVLAGPAVGMFLAELGARVVKVENKRTAGDVTRRWKAPEEAPSSDFSAYWCSVNWGKEVHLLDLQDDNEKRQVLDWVREADVVLSNFKPESARQMGLDYDSLKTGNPRLVYAELTGFPEGDEAPAFDVVLQAEAGFLYMTGEPGREPVKMPVALIDLLAAHQLKEGILLALLQRQQTGKGAFVTTSLFECAVASLANQATNWLMASHIPQRLGAKHPNIAPYGDIFYTRDGKPIVIAAGTEKQFENLCLALELPQLLSDERFGSNARRVVNREALLDDLRLGFQRFTREALLGIFKKKGVPAGSIRDMKEVFELPAAQAMILEDILQDGTPGRRVRTVAFDLREDSTQI
jgi:crotonobetainyl-CoA:carnitine CoA-transferase CaiB-like acyl-CoA transferase